MCSCLSNKKISVSRLCLAKKHLPRSLCLSRDNCLVHLYFSKKTLSRPVRVFSKKHYVARSFVSMYQRRIYALFVPIEEETPSRSPVFIEKSLVSFAFIEEALSCPFVIIRRSITSSSSVRVYQRSITPYYSCFSKKHRLARPYSSKIYESIMSCVLIEE